ncbi:mobilization protein MbpA [Formosa sp. A9]|uniref:mobilization protein MbpA n=1 Tax=Formosa sp. A9 TaxID=3442641 RepID=UPI003EC0970C
MGLEINQDHFGNLNNKEKILRVPKESMGNEDGIQIDLDLQFSETTSEVEGNSRCVSVDTIFSAPEGRRKKKEMFKAKGDLVKFRCTVYEKKLLRVKAKRSGLSISEYVRRCVFEQEILERFTEEHITIYKMLIRYHNNFKSIGNMFKKRDPKLMQKVHALADEIKQHLNNFQR